MNKLLALGFVLVAFGLSFTSCDEEDFQITQKHGSKTTTSTFDLWCDYSQIASRDVDWLRMNNDGSFVLYNCIINGSTRDISTINCSVDSLTGSWYVDGKVVTLDITHQNGEKTSKTMTLNLEESNLLRNVTTDEVSQQLFELLVNKDEEFDRHSLSSELLTIFKSKQSVNDQLLQATTLVISENSDEVVNNIITQKISEMKGEALESFIENMDAETIEAIIENMEPETVSAIVSRLEPEDVENLIASLDAEQVETIMENMDAETINSTVGAMDPETIEAIVESMQQETVEYLIKSMNQEIILSVYEASVKSGAVGTLTNSTKQPANHC